jgi:triacylglycerol lipase
MPRSATVDLDLAVFLAEACKEAYGQFLHDGRFTPPDGFEPLLAFKTVSMGESEWFGYIARSQREIIVAFRGTVTNRDWVTDAEFFQVDFPYAGGQLRTHDGFTKLYCTCRDEIMRTLLDQSDTLRLYVTGHSLGAALASLCAMDADMNTSFCETIMYGFAGPRIGDPAFARAFNKQGSTAVRVVNVHDVVPRLPPRYVHMPESSVGLRYQHVGREFRFSVQTGSVKGNHEIDTYIHELKRLRESPPDSSRILRLRTYEPRPDRVYRARSRRLTL